MKHSYNLPVFIILVCTITGIHAQTNIFPSSGSTGIGTITPAASALLDVQSTTQGFLAPRMTKTQRDAIVAPSTGLLIYQTNSTPGFYYYSGAAWTAISTKGANTSLSNLVATTAINQHLQPGTDNTIDLGSSTKHWNEVYTNSIKFMDGTTQSTASAGSSYSAGTGITITGTVINNTAPDQIVTISGAGETSVTGTYPNFTISSTETDPQVSSSTSNKIPKWNGTALVDGAITDNGTNVGIGTTTPTALLEVSGGDAVINGLKVGIGPGIGLYNTVIGEQALISNIEGGNNSAIGYRALYANTEGLENTAVGSRTLYSNTSGTYNVANGANALYSNTSGEKNIAVGNNTLFTNSTGYENTAVGMEALYSNTTGNGNLAVGAFAMTANTTGVENTALGGFALNSNTTGKYNTAVGYESQLNNTGWLNTSVGDGSLKSNTIGEINVAIGASALYSNTSGYYNSALGADALFNNTSGNHNAASGYHSLYSNTTGEQNTAMGSFALNSNTTGKYNTAIGYESQLNNTGWLNTSVGDGSLKSNTIGEINVAIGANALFSNTSGYYNSALGADALFNNTSGSYNAATGYRSLYSNTTGEQNSAMGSFALNSNTAGWANHAGGYRALYTNTSGFYNTATGAEALYSNTTGYYNTASGFKSLYSNTTASGNTAYGYKSLYLNTTGYDNVAVGELAMNSNTTGYKNNALGSYALYSNTDGWGNTAIGDQTLYDNTTGDANTAVGRDALESNTTAFGNSGFGYQALQLTTSGASNAAMGTYALEGNTVGSGNSALGYLAGNAPTDNSNCTYLGYDANDVVAGTFSNSTPIGYSSRITASNQVRIGNSFVTSIGGYVSWTNISDGRFKENVQQNVPGLEFITKLEPVTYTLDINGLRAITGEDISAGDENDENENGHQDVNQQTALNEKEKIIYSGFIAQDVEKAAADLNYSFSGVDIPGNEHTPYGLRYAEFVVPIVQAIKELDSINQEKDASIAKQTETIEALESSIQDLQSQIDVLTALVMQSVGQTTTTENYTGGNITSTTISLNGAWLEQNIPNPFSGSTIIRCFIPEGFQTAEMIITSQNGITIHSASLYQSGINEVTIDAHSIASGAYFYALIIDGNLIDKKQMLLTK